MDASLVPVETFDMPNPEIEQEFARDMAAIYVRAKKEVGYNASAYLQMLQTDGAMETARRLVMSKTPSSGFATLWERQRLDLTVEALVLDPRFAGLLPDELVDAARIRLREYGYSPTDDSPAAQTDGAAIAQHPSPPPPPAAEPSTPPAGWYDDPYKHARLRWWDGAAWTDWTDASWKPPSG